jgi:transcriptional regulator with XRE-family HTH domain
MDSGIKITGRVIAAARALAEISQADFAEAAGLSVEALARMEDGGSGRIDSESVIAALSRALDHYGVIVLPESGNMGAGVRLKFTRHDVRQIARLESEGGTVGSDDAP